METRKVPPGYEMLDLVLQFLEILYVGKIEVIKPHGGDDHRVPGFF
jgi:hypothetical protein